MDNSSFRNILPVSKHSGNPDGHAHDGYGDFAGFLSETRIILCLNGHLQDFAGEE